MSRSIPIQSPSARPNSQHNTVATNTIRVSSCSRFHGSRSVEGAIRRFSRGRSNSHSSSNISGSMTSTAGRPMRNQLAKSSPVIAAAIAFGGLPTSVPIPPILAE